MKVIPEQKVVCLPATKCQLDPGGIASGNSDSNHQWPSMVMEFLSGVPFKGFTLNYDEDDKSVGYFANSNMLCPSFGRDYQFTPVLDSPSLNTGIGEGYQGRVLRRKFWTSKS